MVHNAILKCFYHHCYCLSASQEWLMFSVESSEKTEVLESSSSSSHRMLVRKTFVCLLLLFLSDFLSGGLQVFLVFCFVCQLALFVICFALRFWTDYLTWGIIWNCWWKNAEGAKDSLQFLLSWKMLCSSLGICWWKSMYFMLSIPRKVKEVPKSGEDSLGEAYPSL